MKHLKDNEMSQFIGYLEAKQDFNSLVLMLLIVSGARQSEVVTVTQNSIENSTSGRIRLLSGKGSYTRTITFPSRFKYVVDALHSYLTQHGGSIGSAISDSPHTKHQCRNLQRIFHTYLNEAIGPNKFTLHSLRHTYAVQAHQILDKDLRKLQLAMGHKNISSTAHYLRHIEADDVQSTLADAWEKKYA